jgi:hypothetical protein
VQSKHILSDHPNLPGFKSDNLLCAVPVFGIACSELIFGLVPCFEHHVPHGNLAGIFHNASESIDDKKQHKQST